MNLEISGFENKAVDVDGNEVFEITTFLFHEPKISFCSTSSRVVNLGHAHATMGQNCTLGARALTLGDHSSAVVVHLDSARCRIIQPHERGFVERYSDPDLRRDSPGLHGGHYFDDMAGLAKRGQGIAKRARGIAKRAQGIARGHTEGHTEDAAGSTEDTHTEDPAT